MDKLDEPEPRSKRRSRAVAARDGGEDDDEDGEDESEEEAGSEEEGAEEGEESEGEAPRAAWVDEDDATLKVDVMQQKKLRKLRKTKKEAVLQGADYEERLREQWRSTQWQQLEWQRVGRQCGVLVLDHITVIRRAM